jgi:hypothetical protein
MDPMGGVVPGGSPSVAGVTGSGSVQRKVAGTGGAGPQPTFKGTSHQDGDDDDAEDGPWHKDKNKKKLAMVAGVFLLAFGLMGLPALGVYPYPHSLLFGGDYRNKVTTQIAVDYKSIKIEEGDGVVYVVGAANNTSSETFEQVELHFHLLDKSGERLGDAMDYKDKMGPNSAWTFKAACQFSSSTEDVAKVELTQVIVQ